MSNPPKAGKPSDESEAVLRKFGPDYVPPIDDVSAFALQAQGPALSAFTNNPIDPSEEDDMNQGSPAGSFNTRVGELAVGDSVSKTRAVDPTMTIARLPAELPSIRTQVRNSCSPAVRLASQRNKGAVYRVEVGDVIMASGQMYVVGVVTRTE